MFAGRRRRSSTIRAMQLFHELKQQFPTVPDHVVSSCIASHSHDKPALREQLIQAAVLTQDPMGRSQIEPLPPTLNSPTQQTPPPDDEPITEAEIENPPIEIMNDNNDVTYSKTTDTVTLKRPDHLDLKPEQFGNHFEDSLGRLQLSEKCRDVYKLLNSDKVSDKPPRSPLNNKRLLSRNNNNGEQGAIQKSPKKETASTPTQTTDTLMGGLGNNNRVSPPVNLSLNVNCSMDLVQSPTANRRTSVLQVTPQQPWLLFQETPSTSSPTSSSPRSYTSVNLTLRPPTSEPQAPIDITSQNSSLTYSTSSFDSQKGLQSRLQITVGPGGSGSVSSVRARPRSSYHPDDGRDLGVVVEPPVRTNSLNSLVSQSSEPPVILKQQARIERLRIELKTEKANLIVMQQEVSELEKSKARIIEHKVDAEFEKQLRREIKHLQYQCSQLATDVDKVVVDNAHEDFYNNIYTGQRGQLIADGNATRISINSDRMSSSYHRQEDNNHENLKWDCPMCTFLNHPDLDKCEQCDMPRILHGKNLTSSAPPVNNNNPYSPYCNNNNYSIFYQNPSNAGIASRPIGFVLPQHNNNPQVYLENNVPPNICVYQPRHPM